jgi:hypothetical protein
MSRWETARLLTALFVLMVGAYTLGSVLEVTRRIESTRLAEQRIELDVDEGEAASAPEEADARHAVYTDAGLSR